MIIFLVRILVAIDFMSVFVCMHADNNEKI